MSASPSYRGEPKRALSELSPSDMGCAVQIEEHLGLQVPFTAIFQYPTLRQLAAHILHLLNTPESAPICALQDADTGVHPSLHCFSSGKPWPLTQHSLHAWEANRTACMAWRLISSFSRSL